MFTIVDLFYDYFIYEEKHHVYLYVNWRKFYIVYVYLIYEKKKRVYEYVKSQIVYLIYVYFIYIKKGVFTFLSPSK